MRKGLAASAALHLALIAWGLFTLPPPKPLDASQIEAIPVDLVPVAETTKLDKGSVTAAIAHGSVGQLSFSLISPDGKSTLLSSKNGGQSSDVWNGTTFSDNAALLVGCTGTGCVTYANNVVIQSAIPQGSLSALVGDDPNGTWTLSVTDDTNGVNGTLTSWSLSLTPALCPIAP